MTEIAFRVFEKGIDSTTVWEETETHLIGRTPGGQIVAHINKAAATEFALHLQENPK